MSYVTKKSKLYARLNHKRRKRQYWWWGTGHPWVKYDFKFKPRDIVTVYFRAIEAKLAAPK